MNSANEGSQKGQREEVCKFKKEYIDFDTEKNKLARPPQQAYLFFPTGLELITFDEKNPNKIFRKIFDNVEYNDFEKNKLVEFKKSFSEKSEKSEKEDLIDDGINLRFLQSTEFDIGKTVILVQKHLKWRKVSLPVKINNNIISILNSGFIYLHGRDNRFRPMVIVSPRHFRSDQYSHEDWLNSVLFVLEYCIHNLFIPGQVENWNLLLDLKDVSHYSVPSDLKNIMTVVQDNYKCRLNTMYVVNLGSFANILWKLIKKMLGESIEKKLKMIKNYKELCEYIHISQIEKKFGGTAENTPENIFGNSKKSQKKEKFIISENEDIFNSIFENKNSDPENFIFLFPPRLPSDIYLPTEQLEKVLSSQEEYVEKLRNDPKIIKSPFLYDRMSVNIENGFPILHLDGEVFSTARENLTMEKNDFQNDNSEIFDNNAGGQNPKEKSEIVMFPSEMSLSSKRNHLDKNEQNSNKKCRRRDIPKEEFSPLLQSMSISTNCKVDCKVDYKISLTPSIINQKSNNLKINNNSAIPCNNLLTNGANQNKTKDNFKENVNVPCFEFEINIEKESKRGCTNICGNYQKVCLIF